MSISTASLPLSDAEKQSIRNCRMNSLASAGPGIVFGMFAHNALARTPYGLPISIGVGLAACSGLAYMGMQNCIRTFASEPNWPTAVVLRQHVRERDPDHWSLASFDALNPRHDEEALRNGGTRLGSLPTFTPDESIMKLLLAKGLPQGEIERRERAMKKATETAAAAEGKVAAVASTASSSSRVRDAPLSSRAQLSTRSDDWNAAQPAESLPDIDDPFAQRDSSDDDESSQVSAAQRAREEQQRRKQERKQQRLADYQAKQRGASTATGSDYAPRRKQGVRYNEFGDEIVEDDSMDSR